MRTYTVHERRVPSAEIEERAGDLIFVKEGFSFWTLIVPPVWLLIHGLWRSTLVFILLSVAVGVAQLEYGLNEQLTGWAMFVINLIFAFEARDLYRGALERRGYELIGVVSGRDYEEVERRFLLEWLPYAKRDRQPPPQLTASNPAPSGGSGGARGHEPVIGMFPSHGG